MDEQDQQRLPTADEIADLVAYLPRLYGARLEPIVRWQDHERADDESIGAPWPVYSGDVGDFFGVLDEIPWADFDYQPERAKRMLGDEDAIRVASLQDVKEALAYCTRGERFCTGFWATAIEEGHIRRLLERLSDIGQPG